MLYIYRAGRYEPNTDLNMSRSLSLTDLNQPLNAGYRPMHHRSERHHQRGYTSDEEYTSAYRRRARVSCLLLRLASLYVGVLESAISIQ